MASPDAHQILLNVLARYEDAGKWKGATFERIKRLSNTKVGDAGQDFVEVLCKELGFECDFPEHTSGGGKSRQSLWDIKIEGVAFELKTATEDVHRAFQFNHIRYHRQYEGLLCVGVAPESVLFDAWSKAGVTTGKAGRLVTMDKGSSATFKLTKRPGELRSIDEFESHPLDLIADLR